MCIKYVGLSFTAYADKLLSDIIINIIQSYSFILACDLALLLRDRVLRLQSANHSVSIINNHYYINSWYCRDNHTDNSQPVEIFCILLALKNGVARARRH